MCSSHVPEIDNDALHHLAPLEIIPIPTRSKELLFNVHHVEKTTLLIRTLNNCIEHYNQIIATTSIEPLEKTSKIIAVLKEMRDTIRDFMRQVPQFALEASPCLNKTIFGPFYELVDNYLSTLEKKYITTGLSHNITIEELITIMPQKSINTLLTYLNEFIEGGFLKIEVCVENFLSSSTHTAEERSIFINFFRNNSIKFLGGSNSHHFCIDNTDGQRSVLSLLKLLNARTAEYHLRKHMPTVIAPLMAERMARIKTTNAAPIPIVVSQYYQCNLRQLREKNPHRRENFYPFIMNMASTMLEIQDLQCMFPDAKLENWLIRQDGTLNIADTKSLVFTDKKGNYSAKIAIDTDTRVLIQTESVSPPEVRAYVDEPHKIILQADKVHAYLLGINIARLYRGSPIGQKMQYLITSLTHPDPTQRISMVEACFELKFIEDPEYSDNLRNIAVLLDTEDMSILLDEMRVAIKANPEMLNAWVLKLNNIHQKLKDIGGVEGILQELESRKIQPEDRIMDEYIQEARRKIKEARTLEDKLYQLDALSSLLNKLPPKEEVKSIGLACQNYLPGAHNGALFSVNHVIVAAFEKLHAMPVEERSTQYEKLKNTLIEEFKSFMEKMESPARFHPKIYHQEEAKAYLIEKIITLFAMNERQQEEVIQEIITFSDNLASLHREFNRIMTDLGSFSLSSEDTYINELSNTFEQQFTTAPLAEKQACLDAIQNQIKYERIDIVGNPTELKLAFNIQKNALRIFSLSKEGEPDPAFDAFIKQYKDDLSKTPVRDRLKKYEKYKDMMFDAKNLYGSSSGRTYLKNLLKRLDSLKIDNDDHKMEEFIAQKRYEIMNALPPQRTQLISDLQSTVYALEHDPGLKKIEECVLAYQGHKERHLFHFDHKRSEKALSIQNALKKVPIPQRINFLSNDTIETQGVWKEIAKHRRSNKVHTTADGQIDLEKAPKAYQDLYALKVDISQQRGKKLATAKSSDEDTRSTSISPQSFR